MRSSGAPGAAISRRIVGNLDFETSLARMEAERRRARGENGPDPKDSRLGLPPAVRATISALATLLRGEAESDDDRLWTPEPVDPARVPVATGPDGRRLALPRLESGPIERLPQARETLSFGEVSEASLRANHRAFCLELAQKMGLALPGARMVRSIEELEGHLREGVAAAAPEGAWVLKAPHSAAGRSRARGKGAELGRPARARVERLLELHGELLFEPWMARLADFGLAASAGEAGMEIIGLHRLEVDAGGTFRGIAFRGAIEKNEWLRPEEEKLLLATGKSAGEALRDIGYRGYFGLDAWRYVDAHGEERFQPLGEINARRTMGLAARKITERLLGEDFEEKELPVRLRIGRGGDLETARVRGSGCIPLLLPGASDLSAAWLQESRKSEVGSRK